MVKTKNKTNNKEQYLAAFAAFEKTLNGASNTPIHQLRRAAIERFGALGFPTTRDEEWRFTNLAPLFQIDFQPAAGYDPGTLEPRDLEGFTFPELKGGQLVFVNGHYVPELSALGDLPDGAQVASLAVALQETPELVQAQLDRHVSGEAPAFTALNTAFIQDGAFVYLPDNAVLAEPLHLLFVSTAPAGPTMTHPRTLIAAGAKSQATIIQTYAGLGGHVYLTNALTEVAVGEGATLEHYNIQRESAAAFHVSTLQVHEQRDCSFTSNAITLDGRLTRNNVTTILDGEGVESTLNGLYVVGAQQHVDNHTLIEHVQPHGESYEYYRGIMDGQSTGSFRGRILVHQAAQKTNAYQSNQNLLLSGEAEINTKPQLEIYADDVRCSHGSTVGQLDPDAIFYLRARGIGEEEAIRLLVHAFIGEVLERLKVEPVRRQLEELVTRKLEAGRRAREGK